MVKVSQTLSRSVNEQARSLDQWDQRYNQISSGEFSGTTEMVDFEDLMLAREMMTSQVEQRASPPEGFVAFSIPSVPNQIVHLDEKREQNRVGLMWSGTRYHAMTERASHIVVVTMRQQMLFGALDELEMKCPKTGSIAVGNVSALFERLDGLLALIKAKPEILSDDAFCRRTVGYIVAQCARAISQDGSPLDSKSSWRIDRKRIVRASCDAADEAGVERATLALMQRTCRVSPRILQYAFQEVLGISPLRWLKLARLNKARRDLESNAFTSVTDAALCSSFNHLGRFSTSYRMLFGESPNQTLQKFQGCVAELPAM
ncbi:MULTISPECIES: helix-turn-helix domain-containing protein [unclassified Rhizobium]|uniref:helix-turn-helix domain-containing protein n=1 Tax=unclassified Rhizobium TaxID=2613769 RepID=UPI00160B5A03|nr:MULTISPECIES: helix-turn-helix domain-containing protein [unclassified Rhizobium]MBB3386229.1 AraC-like DNA-binding protein [Rhizobium sp. BK098]MBB3571916.1 AraC-like DNA-binding protein [Rhizobium sp. BK491]MBB3617933.1 AraC-like DNA-binding protein [Rhizobium sp. BK609]MBB3683614.1 AraC-like DNA-binding protein [Rhizobium sp. BK612]